MSRTASLDRSQAETILGTRGNLVVTVNNRAEVRKWLTACGLPGIYVATLPNSALGFAYNDTTDEILNEHFRIAGKQKTEQKTEQAANVRGDQAAMETFIVNKVTPVIDVAVSDTKRQLLTAFEEFIQQTSPTKNAPIDADAVRQIISEELAKTQRNISITVTRADETKHTIKGHVHPTLAKLIKAASSRMPNGKHPNIMLVGPTGSGKTHAVEQVAEALGLDFYTNGAISMDHQLVGFVDANGKYHETPFRKAFGRPAIYLFDEIDSSDNSPLLALAGALANNAHGFPDQTIDRHPDSIIIAAGNTWGNGATSDFVGRNKLDGAIRSRFPVRISWGYDEELETAISGNAQWASRVQRARANANKAGLKVTIDPRMTQAGSALIASGMTSDEAAELTYLADLNADQRRLVEAA